MSTDTRLVSESLDTVLHDCVQSALTAQAVHTAPSTQEYLAKLLQDHLRVAPETWTRTFGLELVNSGSLHPQLRYTKLKELADTTLFLSGVFLDYLEARMAATEYYFSIGSQAYLSLGDLDGGSRTGSTYTDLGTRFEEFARALTMVADRELSQSKQRIVMLYEKWVRTGQPRYQRRLMSLGVVAEDLAALKAH